jgi:hypothetical protein
MIRKFYKWLLFKLISKLFSNIEIIEYYALKREIYTATFDAMFKDFATKDKTASELFVDLVQLALEDKEKVYTNPFFRYLRKNNIKEYRKLLKYLDYR